MLTHAHLHLLFTHSNNNHINISYNPSPTNNFSFLLNWNFLFRTPSFQILWSGHSRTIYYIYTLFPNIVTTFIFSLHFSAHCQLFWYFLFSVRERMTILIEQPVLLGMVVFSFLFILVSDFTLRN